MLIKVLKTVEGYKYLFTFSIIFALLEGLFNAISITTLVPILNQFNSNSSESLTWPFSLIPIEYINNFGFLFIFLGISLCLKIVFATSSAYCAQLIRKELWTKWVMIIANADASDKNLSEEKKKSDDGKLVNILSREVNQATSLVSGYITFLSQVFTFLMMIMAMFIVNVYVATVGLLVCGIIYFFIFRNINYFIKLRALKGIKFSKNSAGTIVEYIKGSNDLRFLNSYSYMLNKLDSITRLLTRNNLILTIVQLIPKYFIELVLGIFLLILGYFSLIEMTFLNINSIGLPEMIFFLVAFQRIAATSSALSTLIAKNIKRMPSLDLVNSYILDTKMSSNLFKDLVIEKKKRFRGNNIVTFEDVTYSYDLNTIIESTSLSVENNSVIFIYGASGSGKTTIAKLIVGDIAPTSGKIFLFGKNAIDLDFDKITRDIGYIPQEPKLFSGSIRENIFLNIDENESKLDNLDYILKLSGLSSYINSLKMGIDTIIDSSNETVSVGQKCRIAIARTMIRRPSLIIFDETLDRLDADKSINILENLQKNVDDISIIVITHRNLNLNIKSKSYNLCNKKIILRDS